MEAVLQPVDLLVRLLGVVLGDVGLREADLHADGEELIEHDVDEDEEREGVGDYGRAE